MKIFACTFFLVTSLLIALPSMAAPDTPKQLEVQIQNLVSLFSDGYAVGYSNATLFQNFKLASNQEITLTVFSIEGFGGGNNWSQYLAVFSRDSMENGSTYYSLIDVIRVGGSAWRSIPELKAKVATKLKGDETSIVIDTLENVGGDAPNFPSKKAKLKLILKNGRFIQ